MVAELLVSIRVVDVSQMHAYVTLLDMLEGSSAVMLSALHVTLQQKTLSVGDRLLMIEDMSLVGVTYDQVI